MKDSAKIWYSIRRGTLRIALAAFAACAAATVPANVVRNDLVTATSDAELETSDKGMGLGINVVGGGDAVITLETRPGWTFRDGSTTYTMKKLAGVDARSPEIVNEGSTVESGGEISAGETEKEKPEEEKPEEKEPEEGGVEHVPPEVSISVKSVPTAAAYALPANSATVAFELSASVKSDAEHWETDKNGNKTKGPETFSPDEYVWKAVASNTVTAACVEWSTTSSGKSVTGALQLGKGAWKVTFSVYAKATCSTCNETVESAEDDEVRTVTVYEVSINRPDYLGLDQTDAGRKGHTVKDATIVTDPDCTDKLSGDAVIWTACGELCEFKDENGVAKSKGVKVRYRNKGPDNASASLNAEPLTATVTIPGAETVNCTTNFTVVKVDVSIGGTGEGVDETAPQNVIYSRELTKFAITNMTPVKVTCEPKSLPGMELVWLTLPDNVELFELGEDGTAKSAKSYYRYNEIGGKSFGLLGRPSPTEIVDGIAPEFKKGYALAEHYASGAKDKGAFKVVPPPPLEITVNFSSPSGQWAYDPVWDNPSFSNTVDGSLAKWCADNPGEAKVTYRLSRDAKSIEGKIYKYGGKISSDAEIDLLNDMSPLSGVHISKWSLPKDLAIGEYYAKVMAVEGETEEERSAESNKGKVVRGDYCYVKNMKNPVDCIKLGEIAVSERKRVATGKFIVVEIIGTAAGEIAGRLFKFLKASLKVSSIASTVTSKAIGYEFAVNSDFGELPDWLHGDVSIYDGSWEVARYQWNDKGRSYNIAEDSSSQETVYLPDGLPVVVKTTVRSGSFEIGYKCYTRMETMNKDSDPEEDERQKVEVVKRKGFYSSEYESVGVAEIIESVLGNDNMQGWIWEKRPYGLLEPDKKFSNTLSN